MLLEEVGDLDGRCARSLDPEVKRLHAPQREPRVEWRESSAHVTRYRTDRFDQFVRSAHDPSDQIVMPSEILGDGVDDDRSTELDRTTDDGACERVVHDQRDTGGCCDGSEALQIGGFDARVADRFAIEE
jgi:hypothetical protein